MKKWRKKTQPWQLHNSFVSVDISVKRSPYSQVECWMLNVGGCCSFLKFLNKSIKYNNNNKIQVNNKEKVAMNTIFVFFFYFLWNKILIEWMKSVCPRWIHKFFFCFHSLLIFITFLDINLVSYFLWRFEIV